MSKLLSPTSKLRGARLGLDVLAAKARGWLDYSDMRKAAPLDTESAHDYALRALTPELDSYIEPITRAMLMADTSRASKVDLFSGAGNVFAGSWASVDGGAARLVDALPAASSSSPRRGPSRGTACSPGTCSASPSSPGW